MEPDVLNFFLVVLGGFAVVWTFKRCSGRKSVPISDFEYLAFSTMWGIPVFLLFWHIKGGSYEAIKVALEIPMTATPALFLLGAGIGSSVGLAWIFIRSMWNDLFK